MGNLGAVKTARGGQRKGAGRKPRFTHSKKLALANEVTLRQQKNPKLSIASALIQLQGEGLIQPQTRAKYLTPKYLNREILPILKELERTGILSVLPRLSSDDPL